MIVMPFTVAYADGGADAKTAIQVTDSGDLQTALKSDGSIQLDADISTKDPSGDFERLVVTASDVVLDLNGHKLTTEQIEMVDCIMKLDT